jgi:hypothetical protein
LVRTRQLSSWTTSRSTAGTLAADAAAKLVERGAMAVYAAVSHGVFAAGSMERLDQSPIRSLLVTDSIETQPVALSPKERDALGAIDHRGRRRAAFATSSPASRPRRPTAKTGPTRSSSSP